jgi:spermidine synthase
MTIRAASVFAAISGFISLSYEIVWFRVYSYSTGGSPVTFGLVLGVYLAGLAVGADLVGKYCKRNALSVHQQMSTMGSLALCANVCGYIVVPAIGAFAPFQSLVWVGFILIGIAAGLFGGLLPLVSNIAVPADERSGKGLSVIYFANTAGSVVGSLMTGFVLTDVWSTAQLSLFLALAALALTAIAWRSTPTKAAVALGASTLAFAALNPMLFDRLYEKLQYKDTYAGQRFAHIVENRHGVVAVSRDGVTFGGGVYDGQISTSLMPDKNGLIRAYASLALSPRPRRVLMIGLATGAWAQVMVSSPEVESFTAVEINPGYIDLIRHYPEVSPLLSNPKVKIDIDDGRKWLVHHPSEKFDLIVSNTTFHNRANSTNLLSREYLQLVRSRLAQNGVFIYNTTSSQDAFKTAFAVFPYGMRVVNFVAVSDAPLKLDSTRWTSLLKSQVVNGRAALHSPGGAEDGKVDTLLNFPATIRSAPRPIGLESRESVLARIPLARVIADDNMLPEWHTLLLKSDTRPRDQITQ